MVFVIIVNGQEITIMQIDLNYKIYPTRLSQFRWFPKLWVIEQLKIVPREKIESDSLKAGKLTHLILQQFFKEINFTEADKNPETHFLDIVTYLSNNLWDYSINADKINTVNGMLQNFALNSAHGYKHMPPLDRHKKFMPLALEEEIISKDKPIAAIIDRINQSFTVVDYKTDVNFPTILASDRSKLTPEDQIKYDYSYEHLLSQSIISSLLVEEKYGTLPKMFLFVYLRHLNFDGTAGIVPITITQDKIDLVISWVNKMLEDIKNDNTPSCKVRNPRSCYMYNTPCQYKLFCESLSLCLFQI